MKSAVGLGWTEGVPPNSLGYLTGKPKALLTRFLTAERPGACALERLPDSPWRRESLVFCKAALTSFLLQMDAALFVVAVPKSLG